MKFHTYRNSYFGAAAIQGIPPQPLFRLSPLSWYSKGLLMEGPGFEVYIFGWLLKFGWFTKIQRF
jgi:hypothetical protein